MAVGLYHTPDWCNPQEEETNQEGFWSHPSRLENVTKTIGTKPRINDLFEFPILKKKEDTFSFSKDDPRQEDGKPYTPSKSKKTLQEEISLTDHPEQDDFFQVIVKCY